MRTLEDQLRLFRREMTAMNTHINTHGQIQRSSDLIKHWHDLNNTDWLVILNIALAMEQDGSWRLNRWTLADCERLVKHIQQYDSHCDNLLYPTPKITNSLHKKITNFDSSTTVKSITFKTMMNLREAYCAMQDIDLPNEDSSKGKLDPTPRERLFQ